MTKRPTPTTARTAAAAQAALAALAGDAATSATTPAVLTAPVGGGMIVFCPLERLALSPKNERQSCDEQGLADLARDIAANGLLQNLIVYPAPDASGLDLVAGGGRRWRALTMLAGRQELPAELATHGIPCKRVRNEAEALVITVVENMRREDVHFLDRAAAFSRLRDELGWSNIQIGEAVNLGNDAVGQYLRIHDRLPEDLRAAARRGEINFKQARELVAVSKMTDTPLPLPEPEPPMLHVTEGPEDAAALRRTGFAAHPPAQLSVSDRLRRMLAELVPGADRYGPSDRVCVALGGLPFGLDAALRKEFGIGTATLLIDENTTLGGLSRWISGQLAATTAGNAAPVAAPAEKPAPSAPSQATANLTPTVYLEGEDRPLVAHCDVEPDANLMVRFAHMLEQRRDLWGSGGFHHWSLIADGRTLALHLNSKTENLDISSLNDGISTYVLSCYSKAKLEHFIRAWLAIAEDRRKTTTAYNHAPHTVPPHLQVPGEMPFPHGEFAFKGRSSEGGRGTTRLWLEERATGRRFIAVPEQRDIEDTAPGAGRAAP